MNDSVTTALRPMGSARVPGRNLALETTRAHQIVAQSYTELGPYVHRKAMRTSLPTPYAVRLSHVGRHGVRARRGHFLRWAHSVLREFGDFMVGAFQPIKEAL